MKIKMWFFTDDENGQRSGVNCAYFDENEIIEPWGRGRGYEHKETGKMLFPYRIYHEYD